MADREREAPEPLGEGGDGGALELPGASALLKRASASLLCSGSTRTLNVGNVLLTIRDLLPQPMARLTDEQRAALQMLAASAPGHALSTLLVRGCDFEMLQGLVRAGWATVRQHAFGRGKPKILNVRITKAGRKAIGE
jgi:hypothetical protein